MAASEEEGMLGGLLPFHRRIVEELIQEDGLCIMSAGMGWQKVGSHRHPFSKQVTSNASNYTFVSLHLACEFPVLETCKDEAIFTTTCFSL